MIDLDILIFIRDQLLANPNVIASDVYNIIMLGEKDAIIYSLLNKWMEEMDVVEREAIYLDMLARKNSLLNNVIEFRRHS